MQKRKNDSCTGGRTSQNPFLKEERKRKMREKERKLLLFAGTTEGRMLAEYLSKKRIACYVSTATEYGKSLLQEEQLSDIIILAGRMNEEEIKTFLTEKKIDCVVDATHPFAKIVTENIVYNLFHNIIRSIYAIQITIIIYRKSNICSNNTSKCTFVSTIFRNG